MSLLRRNRPFRCIVAAVGGQGGGIGYKNKIPWNIPDDMRHFWRQTKDAPIIMGRGTWESLPSRPLKGRLNFVVSSQPGKVKTLGGSNSEDNVICVPALDAALQHPRRLRHPNYDRTYVIGGEQLYREAVNHPDCEAVEITSISPKEPSVVAAGGNFDTYMPTLPDTFELTKWMSSGHLEFQTWSNTRDEDTSEWAYIRALEHVRDNGFLTSDRTGVGTIQSFGVSLRFPLDGNRIPVLTSKKIHWKSVVEEVLQFARGDIDARKLSAKGVKIWEGNTSRGFLDSIGGYGIEEGSMWKAYGWQWRQWGLPYLGIDAPYDEIRKVFSPEHWRVADKVGMVPADAQKFIDRYPHQLDENTRAHDQLQSVINQLRNEPTSRRIILSAWNVDDLEQMCLPPCHMVYGFNVTNGRLNCQMYQRSWDMFLGAPFNIAGTALLVRLLCATTGLKPGEIKIDALNPHVYSNHIDQVNQLCDRAREEGLYRFPELVIDRELNSLDDWRELTLEDLRLVNYKSHGTIKAPMAV